MMKRFSSIPVVLLCIALVTKALAFAPDTSLSDADASYIGEHAGSNAGLAVASSGDVNGDGYGDILIGAYGYRHGSTQTGKAYLILGKSSGWAMDTNLSATDASFLSPGIRESAGFSVAFAGDVNGDGYDDILIGAHTYKINGYELDQVGKVYLVFGKDTGWAPNTDLSAADASFIGEHQMDYAGYSVASAGDVNGDGYDDILIGAQGGGCGVKVYLILGRATGWTLDSDLSTADASFISEHECEMVGESLASAGDVNGDGYDDILIGASGNADGGYLAGKAYIVFGKSTGWSVDTNLSTAGASFMAENAFDRAGDSVASAGDVNGDGYDDILIGAPGYDGGCGDEGTPGLNCGKVYLIFGKSSSWTTNTDLSTADASFIGEETGIQVGFDVESAGDINNDGYDDVLFGCGDEGTQQAPRTRNGKTYLVFGKSTGWMSNTDLSTADASFIGEHSYDMAGRALASGDVNGDGYDDILIGAYGNSEGGYWGAGQTYLVFGHEVVAPNQPPTVDAGGPYSVDEGGSVLVMASGSDPDGDPLIYAWDLDDNGTFETSGQSVTFSAADLDGPSSYIITVQVADSGDLSATDPTTVEVLNVTPTAIFTNTTGTIVEGQAATLAFSNQFDPGVDDTAAGFLYSYDCTNDGAFELSDASAPSFVCDYPDSGTLTAKGRIKDKDGGFTDYTVVVTVLTPAEGTQDLIDTVDEFNLQQGIDNSLDAKLDAALQALDDVNDNNDVAAINSLQAFINAVEAQRGNKLTDAQADELVEKAQAVINSLS
jgi:hypothetical protein